GASSANTLPRFPPHTRGSTPVRIAALELVEVSPAYAGIDPPRAATTRVVLSFPRIRGDRPRRPGREDEAGGFPPHTRGSTLTSAGARENFVVSPAYAGIDRDRRRSRQRHSGFPRIRGD